MSIKVGDLVMVVKPTPCCGEPQYIGQLFTVDSMALAESKCAHCGKYFISHNARTGKVEERRNVAFEISRLIKIDPPSMPESLEREKELSV